jgi:hypothetical protein
MNKTGIRIRKTGRAIRVASTAGSSDRDSSAALTSGPKRTPVADALKSLGYTRLRIILTAGALVSMWAPLLVYRYGQTRACVESSFQFLKQWVDSVQFC